MRELYGPPAADPAPPPPVLGIVVVNLDGAEILGDCLGAVSRSTFSDFCLAVVDNGSTDGSGEVVRAVGGTFIALGSNFGFAHGANVGIRWALERGCRYVMLLNNDAVVAPDTLSAMIAFLESYPTVAAAGPTVYRESSLRRVWYAGGSYSLWWGMPLHVKRKPKRDEPKEVTFLPFCAAVLRNSVLRRLGPLREEFFMYAEDVEYSCRLRAAGERLYYVPAATVVHEEGWTARRSLPADLCILLATRNLLYVHRSFRRLYHVPTFLVVFAGRWVLGQTASSLRRGRRFALLGILRGVRAYLRGDSGPVEQSGAQAAESLRT